MSLIDEFQNRQKQEKTTQDYAVKRLNIICGGKARSSEFSEMKAGKRPLGDCYRWQMLNDTAELTLSKHGYHRKRFMRSEPWRKFIDDLDMLSGGGVEMLDKFLPLLLKEAEYSRYKKIKPDEWKELLIKLLPPERV